MDFGHVEKAFVVLLKLALLTFLHIQMSLAMSSNSLLVELYLLGLHHHHLIRIKIAFCKPKFRGLRFESAVIKVAEILRDLLRSKIACVVTLALDKLCIEGLRYLAAASVTVPHAC